MSATTTPAISPSDRVLRLSEVCSKTGLSRSNIYFLASKSRFPCQLKLIPGGRCSGWLESEINNWISERVAERDANNSPRAA